MTSKPKRFGYGISIVKNAENKQINLDSTINLKIGEYMNTESNSISPDIIAAKNDELRRSLPSSLPCPHRAMMSSGVAKMPPDKLRSIMLLVRDFDDFTEDPYGEHDFGTIEFEGQKLFWKFDYFDKDFKYFEENGARVLMVMSAHEY